MAISVNQNGRFEELGAWMQILQIVANSTVFYLLFDNHDSPGSIFIWKSKFTIKYFSSFAAVKIGKKSSARV